MTKAVFFDFFGVLNVHGQPNAEIVEFIKANNNKYLFGILSSAMIDLTPWLEEHELAGYFALTETSAKVGLSKLDPKFYKKAMDLFKVKPKSAVFLDDSDEYVQLAKLIGLKAALYDHHKNFLSQIEPLL